MSTRSTHSGSPLLSPPNPKTAASPAHSFFTPRRPPLRKLPSSDSNARQLLSPEESPSRCKKRRLASIFDRDEEPRFAKRAQQKQQQQHEEEDEEMEDVEPVLPVPRIRIRSTLNRRIFMRSLEGFSSGGGAFHCADWSTEVMQFYSCPEDSHTVLATQGHPSLPFTTKACNSNSLVAIGDESGSIRLLESAKNEQPGFSKTYLGMVCHDNAVFDISWSPDDFKLATASGDQSVRVFDVQSQSCTQVLLGHKSSVKQVAFNPLNPAILTSCSRDGSVNVWDLRCVGVRGEGATDGMTFHKPVNSIVKAHTVLDTKLKRKQKRDDISVTSATWLEEFKIATTSEANAQIKVWDIRSSQTKRKTPLSAESSALPPHHKLPSSRPFGLNSLTLSPDGARLYSLCRDSVIYVYSTQHLSNGPIHAYTHPRLHASTFYVKSDISRDGRLLSTGSSDGATMVFPTDERYLDRSHYSRGPMEDDSKQSLVEESLPTGKGVALTRGHEKEVTDVTWTAAGDLVSISDDYQARCWREGEKGEEAENMRDGGEEGGRRWGWGWAEK